MLRGSNAVSGDASVFAAILDHHVTDIDVTDDVTMHRNELPNHVPAITNTECGTSLKAPHLRPTKIADKINTRL